MSLLQVEHLTISFPPAPGRRARAVDDISFAIPAGGALALVGPSGSGKSLTASALLDLVPPPGQLAPESRILWQGTPVRPGPARSWHALRGRRIGLVLQEPGAALDPMYRAVDQVAEAVRVLHQVPRRGARDRARALLTEAGVPTDRHEAWPHQLSGGLRQRVGVALALAGDPDLLVADEPTSALDVTVQAQLLQLLRRLQADRGMSLLLITHDFGVVAAAADQVAVLMDGGLVETGPVANVITAPGHPATRRLLEAVPRLPGAAA